VRKEINMGLRELAEGIILQSIEDLSDQNLREECITFFKGTDFTTCAELAAMGVADQVKLLSIVKCIIEHRPKSSGVAHLGSRRYEKRRRQLQSAPLPSL
jgi:hypothetical protein